MSEKYRLTYFNLGPGRAEVARMLFLLAGVEYEDITLDRKDWPSVKATMPLGQVPALELPDGRMLGQSLVINRYLARKFGYCGKNEWEETKIDSIAHYIEDYIDIPIQMFKTSIEEYKDELRVRHKTRNVEHLQTLEKLLSENDSPYFVGDSMTWVDILFMELSSWPPPLTGIEIDWNQYPRCQRLIQTVQSHPVIAQRIAVRPKPQDSSRLKPVRAS